MRELTTRIKAIGAIIGERDEEKARTRDARLLAEAGGVVRSTPRQDIIPKLEAGLITDTPASGTLFPQPWIVEKGKRVRFDALAGTGWRVVVNAAQAPPNLAVPDGIRVIRVGEGGLVEAEGVLRDWFARHGLWGAIVRPDHYVYAGLAGRDALTPELKGLADRL